MAEATLTLTGLWLHDVLDPAGTALALLPNAKNADFEPEMTLNRYAGRTRPVALFGQHDDFRLTYGALLPDQSQKVELETLIRRKATLCARDDVGRKVFGVVGSLPVRGLFWNGTEVTVVVTETSYSEVV